MADDRTNDLIEKATKLTEEGLKENQNAQVELNELRELNKENTEALKKLDRLDEIINTTLTMIDDLKSSVSRLTPDTQAPPPEQNPLPPNIVSA